MPYCVRGRGQHLRVRADPVTGAVRAQTSRVSTLSPGQARSSFEPCVEEGGRWGQVSDVRSPFLDRDGVGDRRS